MGPGDSPLRTPGPTQGEASASQYPEGAWLCLCTEEDPKFYGGSDLLEASRLLHFPEHCFF